MATPYVIHLDEVGSTQDVAREEFARRRESVLVVADRQVAGRGRTGRTWLEAPRAMYSSLAVAPSWPSDRWGTIPLLTGLAVRRGLAEVLGETVWLKWPNDLLVGDRKVGGILTEASGDVVVIGCGVNLWWPEAPAAMAGVCGEDPGEAVAEKVARAWAGAVLDRLSGSPDAWGIEEYRAACVTIGADVAWDPSGSGTVRDVAEDGALIVESSGGLLELRSGEVRHLRPATLPAVTEEE